MQRVSTHPRAVRRRARRMAKAAKVRAAKRLTTITFPVECTFGDYHSVTAVTQDGVLRGVSSDCTRNPPSKELRAVAKSMNPDIKDCAGIAASIALSVSDDRVKVPDPMTGIGLVCRDSFLYRNRNRSRRTADDWRFHTLNMLSASEPTWPEGVSIRVSAKHNRTQVAVEMSTGFGLYAIARYRGNGRFTLYPRAHRAFTAYDVNDAPYADRRGRRACFVCGKAYANLSAHRKSKKHLATCQEWMMEVLATVGDRFTRKTPPIRRSKS